MQNLLLCGYTYGPTVLSLILSLWYETRLCPMVILVHVRLLCPRGICDLMMSPSMEPASSKLKGSKLSMLSIGTITTPHKQHRGVRMLLLNAQYTDWPQIHWCSFGYFFIDLSTLRNILEYIGPLKEASSSNITSTLSILSHSWLHKHPIPKHRPSGN